MRDNKNIPQIRFAGFSEALPAGRHVGNSWCTYVLECDNGAYYKGKTNDLCRRLDEHLTGAGAEYTKKHKPVALVYVKEFVSEIEAVSHEKYLKSGSGREWLKSVVQERKKA